MSLSLAFIGSTLLAAAPPARVAVVIEDAAPGEPARAALEAALQKRGYELVSRELALEIRRSITPAAVLEGRLPAQLSVLEADAILAGSATYGEPNDVEGVKSVQVVVSARLLDLATAQTTATLTAQGVGLGVSGPALALRGAEKAVEALFAKPELGKALTDLGQQTGSVTLVVQGVASRGALTELKGALERALGGAPVREVYFASGVGKLVVGGSKAKALNGPELGDLLAADKSIPLAVDEVANTRIVATYQRGRAVQAHALVIEPKVPAKLQGSREELGRFVAGELAKLGYLRASYQPSQLSRADALARAKKVGATLIIETEILGSGKELALAIRVIDAQTAQPLVREQAVLGADTNRLSTAEGLVAALGKRLPDQLPSGAPAAASAEPAVAGAKP